jgi:hypothetical protein
VKYIFAEPSHRPIAWLQVISGVFEASLSFLFVSIDAKSIFVLIGLTFVLTGLSEFLPLSWIKIAGVMRLMSVFCLLAACIIAILLWQE